jgi:arsenite methyltransferase
MKESQKRVEKLPGDSEAIVEKVRQKYGEIARAPGTGCCGSTAESCCGPSAKPDSTHLGYKTEDLAALPKNADLGLGCGAPIQHLKLQQGETVLDLGSGPGMDVLIAAGQVGADGHVIGVDMTPEMIERARNNAREAGVSQVEFRKGRLESLPVDDSSIDAVTSNCVINLVPDKNKVFGEIARVLKPGGRMVVSDIVLDGELPEEVASDLMAYVGCVAGAMQRDDYFDALKRAGLTNIEIVSDIDVIDSALILAPDQVSGYAGRAGVHQETLKGLIHSVTYRATR